MMIGSDDYIHLDLEDVLVIHALVIARFGGADGLRDKALLESAIAAPLASFGGKSVFVDAVEIAAAYLFYLCKNHPFLDGNKRTALGACLTFLKLNGIQPSTQNPPWTALTMGIAEGRLTREAATEVMRSLVKAQK
jgi:death-on-curing protein